MSFDPADYNDLQVTETVIPGFYEITLAVHGDNRGWFKENYQREKLEALGLPRFEIVQNNFSYNQERGVLIKIESTELYHNQSDNDYNGKMRGILYNRCYGHQAKTNQWRVL